MAQNDNVVFKTSTTATIDDLFSWNKSTGQIAAKTDNIPIVPGTVYFTADGHIVHDLAQNNRLWMSKNAYSAIYAEDVAETNTDIANAIKYSIHYVEGPTTDTTPGTWTGTINGITELYNGLTIIYVPAVAGGSSTTTLNINGLGAKTCYYSNTSAMTTHYSVGTPILLTYRNNCWRRADYNNNTTYSAMSVAEMRAGTATSERSIRADYLKTFLSTLGGTNLTLTHSNSAPYLQLNHDPSGITAGTYGNNSQQTPSYGGTFNIPYFTVDTQGHITNASTTTVKIPGSDNTDYKVRQTPINSNDNNNYRILLSNSANDTEEDNVSKKNANLIYNPTENKLSTGNIKLTGELDVTGNVYLRNQTTVDNLTAGSLIVNGNSTFNNDINLAQGAVKWTSNSLPSVTSADYFLVIDAFANGGATKHITKANAIKSLISSSAIGSSTKPVYWTGSAFSAITSYSGAAALTGTPTAPTAAAGTSTTQIATTEFVTNAVAQGFVANDAMVFKGLIGSNQPITQLPTSGYNAGWTYRVANAGIFAGEYCEVGDLLIAIKDGPASGSSVINTDWGKVEHNIDGAVFRGSGASNSSVGSSTQPVYVNGSGIVTAITGAIANNTTGNAATATVASKLSNTSAIGSLIQPVYFNSSGQPVAVNTYNKQTGKTTSFVPYVGLDGVMEIGKYIDFHNTSEDTSDYIVRITARDSSETDGAGLTLTGTTVGTFKGNLNGTATKATQDGNGNVITSTYKTKQTAVTDVAVTNTTATEFISSVTQDTNGVISVEKKKLPTYNNYSHPITTATTAAAVKVGKDSTGHVVIGSALTKSDVGLSNVENTKLSTWAGTNNITTLGTITTGSWNGDTIDIAHGGTNATTVAGAWSNIVAPGGIITGNLQVNGNTSFTNETSIDSATINSLIVNGNTSFVQSPIAPTPANNDSSNKLATTEFVYNTLSVADAMIFKGVVNSANDLPVTHNAGWTYKVATAGTYAGVVCEVGDLIVCIQDGTTNTNSHWQVIQTNIDGAVTGPAGATTNHIATFNGNTGKIIQDSGYTIATSVPANAVFTDTKNTAGSTSTNDKIYIIGAKEQSANPQTYSADSTVYISNKNIYANNFIGTAKQSYGLVGITSITNTSGLYFYKGTITNNDPNSTDYTKWSCPNHIANTTVGTNSLILRLLWGNNYFKDIYMSPNSNKILYRQVSQSNGTPIAGEWRYIVQSSTDGVGDVNTPIYITNSGNATAIIGAIANDTTGNAATATVASKLSNTSAIGSLIQPVYFNSSGQPVAVNTYNKQTGKTTDFVPYVGSDGVMEIGKYIDFHNTSEDTSDYIVRITARDSSETDGAGLTLTGTTVGTFKGNLNGTATKATQDGNGNNIINTYLTKTAGVTNITWDNTNKKLIKTINNSNSDIVTLYAANLKLNNTAVYNTELEIKNIKIGNGSISTSTKNVKLEYNETLETLNFVFS